MTHGYGEQAHDYGEQMSLMLDGRLTASERAELQVHLETCDACRAQWAAFQQVDRMLSNAAQTAPAPDLQRGSPSGWRDKRRNAGRVKGSSAQSVCLLPGRRRWR